MFQWRFQNMHHVTFAIHEWLFAKPGMGNQGMEWGME